MDHSPLSVQLKQVYKLSDKELMKVIQLFETVHVKKNEHLYRPGEIVRHVYFVEKGCLRQYYINNNGEDRTIYFKIENGWCSELVSFLDNKPTELCVQALEDSTLQAINQKNWVYAISQIPSFTLGFIRAQQDTNYMLKKRLAEATVETPAEPPSEEPEATEMALPDFALTADAPPPKDQEPQRGSIFSSFRRALFRG